MRSLRRINKENGITVLVSLHQVDFAMQFCDRCIGLRAGRIVFDGPTADLNTELLQELYGVEYCDVEEGIDIYSRVKGRRPDIVGDQESEIQNVGFVQCAPLKA